MQRIEEGLHLHDFCGLQMKRTGMTWQDALGHSIESLFDWGLIAEDEVQFEEIEDDIFLNVKARGLACVAGLDRKISSLFFYSPGYDGYAGFNGSLVHGLAFEDTRSEVRQKLGAPSRSGGSDKVGLLGGTPEWDRYDLPEWSVHVQYRGGSGSISLLTLMAAATAKRIG